jgi:hypothetical protein
MTNPGSPIKEVMTHVDAGTSLGAPTPTRLVHIDTSVPSVNNLDTLLPTVGNNDDRCDGSFPMPSFLRSFVWDDSDSLDDTLAHATEHMDPLPQPPANKFRNLEALSTIRSNSHLFAIITPIKTPIFRQYLATHPNQPLVLSVCQGLITGFWPWADTNTDDRPNTWDNSSRSWGAVSDAHSEFIQQQCESEVRLQRFSPAFGPDLLPGMFGIAIGVVPKPHSTKLRLVVDQSAEPFSLNALIPRDKVAIPLDNLHHLGSALRRVRSIHGPSVRLVVFKSDVSQAYRRLPMHFLWQIHQVVTVNGRRHVDRCNNFGNRGAGGIWGTFMGLVLWIAIYVKLLSDLFAFVDNSFSWEFESNMTWYTPYNRFLPTKQAKLLLLWDKLGLPHENDKQVFGDKLTIIGFEVDPNAMTVSMSTDCLSELISTIRAFAHPGTRHSLHDFQRLAGWMNWSLNVYPLLRPGLSTLYDKMCGKSRPFQLVWVSVALCRELQWFVDKVSTLPGVHFMTSNAWHPDDADVILYSDACLTGLAFWCPTMSCGFQHALSTSSVDHIFFYEALAVVSALHWVLTDSSASPRCVLIYTDNTNSVDLFTSLCAQPHYNPLLITTVDLLITFGAELRVLHIPGECNVVANTLSRFQNGQALTIVPDLCISSFIPPQVSLGADVQ